MNDDTPPVWDDPDMEAKRQQALRLLRTKWLLHLANAPEKGHYNDWGLRRA
ncbi:hypothetical protein UFOVP171_28 [uncultured Caudovirales phage]|uniref:Uncharacterized protein n=1 Tax=uncultured Caudovirales phage TaxID=2100421 RepID=A0A6J7WFG0_9CAUD|nr:hypothetical protein UFOVP171_28 [uncultured Caudovirales phage]